MFFHIHNRTVSLFSARSPVTVISVSLILLVLLGWADYLTGEYSLIIFYLIPVSLVAWFVNWPSGVLFCLLALATRFTADQAAVSFTFKNASLHYWNLFNEFLFLLIMSLLFSILSKNLDKEKMLASSDSLTGTLNRLAFFDIAEYEIKRPHRRESAITMACIALDNFKQINDRLGHAVGDNLLVAVTNTIASNISESGIIARFGGDEFVILLPETATAAATASLEKIHSHLKQAMSDNHWQVTFSTGAITYSKPPPGVDEAINKAVMLMHEVKSSGKNRLLHIDDKEAANG